MPRSRHPALPLIAALAVAGGLGGCDWPRDPGGTTGRVEGKVLRVGVSDNPPFVSTAGGQVSGIEADLVRAIAADLHAQVAWSHGSEGPLMKALKDGKLDLVAAGVTQDNVWSKELGRPKPYAQLGGEKHMLLTPPGENGFLLRLDQITHAHQAELQARVAREARS
jgi:polar amino acid transport system substrate-binding protein